jgi:hypothetical protein
MMVLSSSLFLLAATAHNYEGLTAKAVERGGGGSASLCAKAEKVVFSCRIEKSTKLLSVCSSKDLDQAKGYLQYRFGRTGAIELEFPAERQNTQKQFSYSRYTRPLVTYLTLDFNSNGYEYSLHQDYNEEEKPPAYDSRIEMRKAGTGDEWKVLKCSTRPSGSLMAVEDFVPKTDDLESGQD